MDRIVLSGEYNKMHIIIFVECLCGVQAFNIIIINNAAAKFAHYFGLFLRDIKFEY